MKISVAMTSYNGEKYIRAQLDSILQQTYPPNEIVICDDCSSDATREILEKIREQSKIPILLQFNSVNLGYSQNFAKAISLCTGDLVFLADQDDFWHPEKIAVYRDYFQKNPNLFALFSNSRLIDEDGKFLGQTLFEVNLFQENEKQKMHQGEAWRVLLKRKIVAGHTLAIRNDNNGWLFPVPDGVVHDIWIATLLAFTGKVDFLDECYVDYRQHPQQKIGLFAGNRWQRIRQRMRRAAGQSASANLDEITYLQHLLSRLKKHDALAVEKNHKIVKKIKWLETRSRLSRFLLIRAVQICPHMWSYFEFENGWASLVKDLLFRSL
jgi:glycosyltransferase involved in cell wall biosynthesis